MIFKLSEIKDLIEGLSKINQIDLPIRISYRLSKFLKFCTTEFLEIEKKRSELVKKYSNGQQNENGTFIVLPENELSFRKEFIDLLMEEVEFPIESIPLKALGDIYISPLDLMKLSKIITDEE